ncbi:hypothetical protein B0H34DRAFT_691234 [Crassisporium funariophilum]|nr:hypothetical protein B0H34DRAFT_691234 [Crassisporium funariophilum]
MSKTRIGTSSDTVHDWSSFKVPPHGLIERAAGTQCTGARLVEVFKNLNRIGMYGDTVHVEVPLHSLRDAAAECRYGDTVQEWYLEGCRKHHLHKREVGGGVCRNSKTRIGFVRGEVYQEVPPRELSMMCTRGNFVGGAWRDVKNSSSDVTG